MRIIRYAFLMLPIIFLYGCVFPGQSSYRNDPFTGGIDSASSALLNIPVGSGWQYFPSHSQITGGARKEGLETWRGYVDQEQAARQLYETMKSQGWKIRLLQRYRGRAIYVYQKNDEMAALVFSKQGALTILNIWYGPRLTDDAILSTAPVPDEPLKSFAGEEYGPAKKGEVDRTEESWGVEERDL